MDFFVFLVNVVVNTVALLHGGSREGFLCIVVFFLVYFFK